MACKGDHLLPLTFGVEIEFYWACRFDDYLGQQHQFLKITADDAEAFYLWPQFARNIGQVTKILRRAGLDAVPVTNPRDEGINYQAWVVTQDESLFEVNEEIKGQEHPLSKRQRAVGEKGWFTQGTELVSRILPVPDVFPNGFILSQSLQEVERYTTLLIGKGSQEYTSYCNKRCGLHIHIGLDPMLTTRSLPLDVLQHLCYILFQFEGLISQFHPRKRRECYDEENDNSFVGSNLVGLRRTGHVCDKIPEQDLQTIQDRIFHPHQTIQNLAVLMDKSLDIFGEEHNSRNKFVSFANFEAERFRKRPMTLEFRQHRGTLDGQEISYWVVFVTRLVRAAESKAIQSRPGSAKTLSPTTPMRPDTSETQVAESTTPKGRDFPSETGVGPRWSREQGSKYKINGLTHESYVQDLFGLLHMSRTEEEYWLSRMHEYASEEFEPHKVCRFCVEESRLQHIDAMRSRLLSTWEGHGNEEDAEGQQAAIYGNSEDEVGKKKDRDKALWTYINDL